MRKNDRQTMGFLKQHSKCKNASLCYYKVNDDDCVICCLPLLVFDVCVQLNIFDHFVEDYSSED